MRFPDGRVRISRNRSRPWCRSSPSLAPPPPPAAVRDAQQSVASSLKNVQMICTIDQGGQLHPTSKRPIGSRLARLSLESFFNRKTASAGEHPAPVTAPLTNAPPTPTATGPVFHHARFEGHAVTLSFSSSSGLATLDGKPPRGFILIGDGQGASWEWAEARIRGSGKDATVVLTSPTWVDDYTKEVQRSVWKPVAARYAWADDPNSGSHGANLCNSAGLAAAPFRTDQFNISRSSGGAADGDEEGEEADGQTDDDQLAAPAAPVRTPKAKGRRGKG